MKEITKTAVEAAGGSSELAKVLGITRQAIDQWEKVPPKHVLAVEEASGVSRYTLRPDIYGAKPRRPLERSRSASVAA